MLLSLSKARKRVVLISGVIVAFFLLFYFSGALSYLKGHNPIMHQDTEVTKDDKIKVSADTKFVQKIIYQKCNDEEVFETKPAENQIGLNIFQIRKAYAGWTINRFDSKVVEMSLKVDSFCREHSDNYFIGVQDGYVAVFYGHPGPKAILKEVTKIPVTRLGPEDIDELKKGVVVNSREDLLRTLEGLQSR